MARERMVDGEGTRKMGGGLALFYRKGLIALPITDNATINDLREVGLRMGKGGGIGGTERGTGMEIGTWSRMGMRLGIWEQVEVGAWKSAHRREITRRARVVCACVRACVRTVKQERVDGLIGAKRDKVQSTLEGKGDQRRFATRAYVLVGSSNEPENGRSRARFPFPRCPRRSVRIRPATVWPIYAEIVLVAFRPKRKRQVRRLAYLLTRGRRCTNTA